MLLPENTRSTTKINTISKHESTGNEAAGLFYLGAYGI